MAILCRCKPHFNQGNVNEYTHYAVPVGYPNTSSICGNPICNTPGFILMTADEVQHFNNGQRNFKFPTNATQVRLTDVLPFSIQL